MRVSVIGEDPGYRPDALWYEAYLDGELLSRCVTANEEARYAIVFLEPLSLDENGMPRTKKLIGKVELR